MNRIKHMPKRFEELSPTDRELALKMVGKGVTRREFMGWMMAAGATAAAAGSVFTGTREAWAETPKRGGKLTFAVDVHGPKDTLDPALLEATLDYFRARMFYGSLVRLQDDLSWEPELAEMVDSNADATEWTFKLRKGVEFHNGLEMTADDVIYSMNRHIGEDAISKASALVNMVESWEKVDKYEVRAKLSSPNADLPAALGTFHFKIVQDGWTDFANTVGTGPFKLKEFKPGVRCIGVNFENYWEEGGYLDELEHFAIGDPVARLNAFLSGDIDAMSAVAPKSIPTVEAAEGKDLWAMESGQFISIAARLDMAPSGNAHLIKAMQYLMDRERVVRGVLKGQGGIANDQPIGPAYFDHCADIPQRQLDPDKAMFHFKESGIGSAPVEIITAEVGGGTVEQCLVLQREAKKIGLNIEVKKVVTDGYWRAVWMKAPMCVVRWNMRPTANMMLRILSHSQSKWNDTFWKNEQFDQLLDEVLSVTDPATRKQMYCDMQTMVHETAGYIMPAHLNYIDAAASYVKGRTHVPLNHLGGAESPPYLWKDA